jgi:hypothetical protein
VEGLKDTDISSATSDASLESKTSPSCPLSRKSQIALRQLHRAQKILQDTSIRDEILSVLGLDHVLFSKDKPHSADESIGRDELVIAMEPNNEPEDSNRIVLDSCPAHEEANTTDSAPVDPNSSPSPNVLKQKQVTFMESAHQQSRTSPSRSQASLSPSLCTSNKSGMHSTSGDTRNPYFCQDQMELRSQEDIAAMHVNDRPQPDPSRVHKQVILKKGLKKGLTRPYTHRCTLRLKIIKARSDKDKKQVIHDSLQKFLDIVLQADSKTIIPPYLELDRNNKSVPDISNLFLVLTIDSFHLLKKYFFRKSPRNEQGFIWCSVILAQSHNFQTFTDKAKHALKNQNFSLWPKSSHHESFEKKV